MERYFGEHTPKLGFGLMRLPKGPDGRIDIEHTMRMVDAFLDAGFTYFDTAYVYDNGDSERAARQQIYTSLERTGAGYFDYYLLHAVQAGNLSLYDEYGCWDYVRELKAKGLIRHWGFSFHDTPALLDELLTKHPDAEFVQLQINYADWENPSVQSRACWETARRHGKPVVIMEPVKGGMLANPPARVRDALAGAKPGASPASWAIRCAASLEGVLTVLSGMSDIRQMEDNLSFMRNFQPLNAAERGAIREARDLLLGVNSIPCTGCRYCVEGCPQRIPIPEIFKARNEQLIWEREAQGRAAYAAATEGRGRASDCAACGQCESACPQRIDVIERLKECAASFDGCAPSQPPK